MLLRHAHRFPLTLAAVLIVATVASAGVNVGDKPQFRFVTVDNQAITHETFAGKIVVIDFWATWCGPCMAVADDMVRMNETYGPKGVQMLGVSLDSNISKMKQVAEQEDFNWPHIGDGRGWKSRYAQQFGVTSIPQTFILSPDGEVLWRGHPARLEPEIKKALESHPPRPAAADPKNVLVELAAIQKAVGLGRDLDEAMTKLAAFDIETMSDDNVSRRARALRAVMRRVLAGDNARAEAVAAALGANPDAKAKLEAISERLDQPAVASDAPAGASTDPAVDDEKAEKIAAARLNYAGIYQRADKHEMAVDILLEIAAKYGQTEAAVEAGEMLEGYREDPATAEMVERKQAAVEAAALLDRANQHRAAGELTAMRDCCDQLLAKHPDTPAAADAQRLLDAHPADGKTP